jgi:hypothetical protein
MLRTLLAAGFLGAALAGSPAAAQQSQPAPAAPSAQPDANLVGLPVFSSDGQ